MYQRQGNEDMKTEIFDVDGLSERQIELTRQFISLMKKAGEYKSSSEILKSLIQKGIGEAKISEEEAEKIASEAVAFARRKE